MKNIRESYRESERERERELYKEGEEKRKSERGLNLMVKLVLNFSYLILSLALPTYLSRKSKRFIWNKLMILQLGVI